LPPDHPEALQQGGNPADGPGVSMVEIWTCPVSCSGSNATYRGQATYGLSRPDVAALLGGSRMTNTGFSYTLSGLANGQYQIQVRMRSSHYSSSWNTTSVTVSVLNSNPITTIETPTESASVSQPFTFSGWAIDTAASTGTGVNLVAVHATPEPGSGATWTYWGPATYGGSRPAVGSQYGAQFTNSGFTFTVTGKTPDPYIVLGYARSSVTNLWHAALRDLYIDVPTHNLVIDRPGSGTGGVSATGLSCVGGSTTQAVPCGAAYSHGTAVILTAVADANSSFAGWTGACSGAGSCQVTMTTARFVVATFAKIPTEFDTSYYHTDELGSVRAITDDAGQTIIRHDYLPFGEDTQPLGGDPMRFAGKELDAESALSYSIARYYRNIWGRFTSVDPVGGRLDNPQTWNGYAYAGNNPISFIDPLGLQFTGGRACPAAGGTKDCPRPSSGRSIDLGRLGAARSGLERWDPRPVLVEQARRLAMLVASRLRMQMHSQGSSATPSPVPPSGGDQRPPLGDSDSKDGNGSPTDVASPVGGPDHVAPCGPTTFVGASFNVVGGGGLLPFGLFGGASLTIGVTSDMRVLAIGQVAAGPALGVFGGIGPSLTIGRTPNPGADVSFHAELDFGWGPAASYALDVSNNGGTVSRHLSARGKIGGAGYGVMVGAGTAGSYTAISSCE
jgi:RHS repeat-associated protein